MNVLKEERANDEPVARFGDFWEEPQGRWERVTVAKLGTFCTGVAIFFFVLVNSERGFCPMLDFANLIFHEAGHPIFGLLHRRLEVYGGTFGQLFFPTALMISFWRKGHTISFAVAWIWFFENFLNIARYMADARDLVLPLIGGGMHDWNEIFHRWHMLSYDVTIAGYMRMAGWVGMGTAIGWILLRAFLDYRKYGGRSGRRRSGESGVS